MTLPFLALVFIFSYLPLNGWRYAFYNYKPGKALTDCEFVGFKYFEALVNNPVRRLDVLRVMKNTLGISGIGLLFSWLPMIFAVFLSQIPFRRYKRAVQTLTTLPHFISWVLVYSLAFSMFSITDGFVNRVLMNMHLVSDPINFLASPNHVWLTQWAYGTWKGLGWSAVVYMASIAGIDQEMYEAARIDGASRRHIIRHIEIPCLIPTYFVLLVMSIGNIMNNGMEQYYLFSNAMNKASIEVLDLYVYNQGIASTQISFATAVGMLKSVVGILLLTFANTLSKFVRGESIF
ncbi:MAG: sugar ABC transporter permease [Clostridia bacterium]|nr:sugar ABC transporter permease [Clostridia bacterium]